MTNYLSDRFGEYDRHGMTYPFPFPWPRNFDTDTHLNPYWDSLFEDPDLENFIFS